MDDEELDDETKGMKATLLLLFDGKLEPWPHQVKAVLRLEKERLMLFRKKEDGSGQMLANGLHCAIKDGASGRSQLECPQSLVILGQFGCGIGKSAILVVYAKYLLSSGATKKVLVSTPSVWVTHQLCGLF